MTACFIALALCLAQIALAKLVFDRTTLNRWAVWAFVMAHYATMHLVSLNEPPFLRMVLLCCTLMAGMKWVVYSEWRRSKGEILTWKNWLCFACLWFGMSPAPWVRTKKNLRWKADAAWGAGCLVVGVAGVLMMSYFEVSKLVPLFIVMSLAFHFGVLRLLTAFWRMNGLNVRILFRNPFVTKGFNDFWSMRWNLAYSQMMARAVKRPLECFVGKRFALFGVFLISGLLHELAITVPVQGGYGLPTLFFTLQGFFTTLEKKNSIKNGLLCGLSLVLGLPILFPPKFVAEVIIPARDVLNYLPL